MKAEPRLDPVRRRRPPRSTLARLFAATTLLVVAALVTWSGSVGCGPASTEPGASAAPADQQGHTGGAATRSGGPSERGSPAPGDDGRSRVPPGNVGVPIRLAEPAALTLLHPGDRVDLLRLEEAGGTTAVAAAAVVLSMTGADDPVTGGILVALRPPEARKALSTPGRGFAVLLRPD